MNDSYVEWMVKRKPNPYLKCLKYTAIMLTGFSVLLGIVTYNAIFLLVAVAIGVAIYFINLNVEIEYDYLYVDRQLSIDKVLNKTRRKRVATYDLDRMEILAPLNSHRLDGHKNREVKLIDYSSGLELKPDVRYALFIDGKTKVIFEPSPEMVKAITMIAPRKVFKE